MKKIISFMSVLLVMILFTGCSFLPDVTPVEDHALPTNVENLFNYEGIDYREDQVLVRTDGPIALNTLLSKQGSKVVKEWENIGWKLVEVPGGQDPLAFIEQLRKLPGVIMAEPNMRYELPPATGMADQKPGLLIPESNQVYKPETVPTVPQYNEQWAFPYINAEAAWDITTGSPDVIVAVIDTGLDLEHPEFVGKTILPGFDTTESPNGMVDLDGHGTHVAGIAADDGRTGEIAGVAWDSPLLPIRVEDNNGSIWTSYLIDAMIFLGDYAINNPNQRIVANMSIGGRGYNYAFKDAIDYAYDQGVLLVTSAGNDYKRLPSYPSAFNGVVTVAAVTPFGIKADFSTKGPWTSVAAPGVEILSTLNNDQYGFMQGTSMASPYVCGAAALLLSEYPDLTPLEIKNQIEQTAVGTGFTEELGYGVIDIEAMLGMLEPMAYGSLNVTTNVLSTDATGWIGTAVVTLIDENSTLVGFGTTGEFGNHQFRALKPGTYTVTVSYYDIFADEHKVVTDSVSIAAGQISTVNLSLMVPQDIARTQVYTEDISSQEPLYMFPFSILEDGFYEFETSLYNELCDTVLTLLDADDNIIASNDDQLDTYSYIGINLPAGDYTLVVEEFNQIGPLEATLDIYFTTVTY